MKETVKALIAGFGCTPMLIVVLFIAGTLIGRLVVFQAPVPPQWLIFPAALFPVCFGLYLRVVVEQANTPYWLDNWRKLRRQKVVGHVSSESTPATLEEVWLQTQVQQQQSHHALKTLLDTPSIWQWATLFTFLPLAYICLWYGITLAWR